MVVNNIFDLAFFIAAVLGGVTRQHGDRRGVPHGDQPPGGRGRIGAAQQQDRRGAAAAAAETASADTEPCSTRRAGSDAMQQRQYQM